MSQKCALCDQDLVAQNHEQPDEAEVRRVMHHANNVVQFDKYTEALLSKLSPREAALVLRVQAEKISAMA